ncbi:MAG: acetyl-CoA carboxylase biotin carboxyl carrier protein [Candidatus Omnitrophica bacterium]|jgi:acetyl-CoA carboxylase biotin carboxyl carrier protein|nr:acetyl-CoA carboxylase biotin carboxyl carrier protein [Candidatus Omnitrophota bacterium]MDD3274657.1 acetyl-CoA carboxylase biotin carboxyl carrier protein [Candidatus Omnitrophota bacterium]MDD5077374.1 acetyl-CoA carboxylase biotin carboxyl carrier protein [Candidatus Omnitrophota bacterium]MDD5724862.1 acetyl-CoA carboxylase biotin carboxyl carrier protein [Candidatus Omnitrophota bacterium]
MYKAAIERKGAVNVKEIKEMINLMNENDLAELEVEKEGMRIRLKKTAAGIEGFPSPAVYQGAGAVIPESKAQAPAEPENKSSAKTVEIKSPMVGTFYRAPSPEAPPYVEVGQVIEPGQVICIIEAMKLMNEIKSEIKGKILEILVDNAEPVEFGQSLFLIDPL